MAPPFKTDSKSSQLHTASSTGLSPPLPLAPPVAELTLCVHPAPRAPTPCTSHPPCHATPPSVPLFTTRWCCLPRRRRMTTTNTLCHTLNHRGTCPLYQPHMDIRDIPCPRPHLTGTLRLPLRGALWFLPSHPPGGCLRRRRWHHRSGASESLGGTARCAYKPMPSTSRRISPHPSSTMTGPLWTAST